MSVAVVLVDLKAVGPQHESPKVPGPQRHAQPWLFSEVWCHDLMYGCGPGIDHYPRDPSAQIPGLGPNVCK